VDLFDTAAMYSGGASERRLGELADGRHVVIATKFPPGWLSTAEALPDALDQSLARLRRSTIDLHQHHFPSRRVSLPALMGLMADAVEAGRVRAIGVSNYSAAQLRVAHAELAERGIPLASNQVEYSLLHRQPEVNGVLDACRELGSHWSLRRWRCGGSFSRSTSCQSPARRMGGRRSAMPKRFRFRWTLRRSRRSIKRRRRGGSEAKA
jgi:aryl-alcohol dehydrogenase-like predicted oxidoreductase